MGASTCCPHDFDQQVLYNLETHKMNYIQTQNNQKTNRKGFPSQSIAIEMSQIYDTFYKKDELRYINNIIQMVKQNQKSRQRKIYIHIPRKPNNQLAQPYYIPQLKAFYIGQWIYYQAGGFKDNVPGGIGRLYEKQWISQGSIVTVFPVEQQLKSGTPQAVDYKQNDGWGKTDLQKFRISEIQFVDKSGKITTKQQVQPTFILQSDRKTLQPQKQGIMKTKNRLDLNQNLLAKGVAKIPYFNIFLDGYGRKFNKNQLMVGYFKDGLLHGRQGRYQIKQPKYSYTGQWQMGERNGKGVQVTELTQYTGDFSHNKKTGNGSLIFKLSNAKENQRLIQESKIKKKMSNEDEAQIRNQIKFQVWKNNKLKQLLAEKLKQLQWKPSFTAAKSQFQDQQFLFERKIKEKFLEIYIGQFKDNQMHGKGVYTWYNGKTFSGQFVKGKIEGVGQFYWPDNVIYRGQYRNDRKHGKGQIIWSLRRRYRGSWAFGIRHGYGQSISIDQDVLTIKGNLWKEDKQVKLYFKEKIIVDGFSRLEKMTFNQYFAQTNKQILNKGEQNISKIIDADNFLEQRQIDTHMLSAV